MANKAKNSLDDWFEIRIEKKKGSPEVDRFTNASDVNAALNGVQMLLEGLAVAAGVPMLNLLAIMAARIAAPALREEQGENKNGLPN